jgi:hypothetical protein
MDGDMMMGAIGELVTNLYRMGSLRSMNEEFGPQAFSHRRFYLHMENVAICRGWLCRDSKDQLYSPLFPRVHSRLL